jgi:hypothetical protein
MASVPGQMDRNPLPGVTDNIEMAQAINDSPVFSALAQEVAHDREVSAMRHYYQYHLPGELVGQQTAPFTLLIEQGTDFKCYAITGRAYSYDANVASDFPIPNALGLTAWAGSGLSFMLTDTRSGRQITSGMVPVETVLTPGYGQLLVNPMPFRYFFYRNSKLRFDIRNRDNAGRTHQFDIVLHGFKIYTPDSAM